MVVRKVQRDTEKGLSRGQFLRFRWLGCLELK